MEDLEKVCKNCKYWAANSDTYPEARMWEWGTDEKTKILGPWSWCDLVAELGPTGSDKFFVRDASMYTASLHTRADFGCVEWSGRSDG
jgi:hypothetical protein